MRASSNTAATQARTWGAGKPAVAMAVAVALMSISLKLTAIIKSAAKIRRPTRTAAVVHPAPFVSVVMLLSFSLRISKLCGFAGRAAFGCADLTRMLVQNILVPNGWYTDASGRPVSD